MNVSRSSPQVTPPGPRWARAGLVGFAVWGSCAATGLMLWQMPGLADWFAAATRPAAKVAPYRLKLGPVAAPGVETALLQRRIAANPTGWLDLVGLAHVYMGQARATGDLSWYLLADQAARRSLVNHVRANHGAKLVLLNISIAKHDFISARRLVSEVALQAPGNPDLLAASVSLYLATGDVAQAALAAEALVRLEPSSGALTQRALVRIAQGRDAEAIADFQAAVAREQAGAPAASALTRAWWGRLHASRGRLEAAFDLYGEALRLQPESAVILGLSADLELHAGQYAKAATHYEQAFRHSQGPACLIGLAKIKTRQGDLQAAGRLQADAEAQLRQDLKDGGYGHRRDLARLLLTRGRAGDDLEALALMAVETQFRHDPETLAVQAWALTRAGRWPEARQAVQRALASGVRDAALYHQAGLIMAKLGEQAHARDLFRAARLTDPTYRPRSGAAPVPG
ncbi:MAG: hypothetical protein H7338_19990 [Candidatus Sericytochromatia bacterium]|nr:hypothetical protein [Candidatus Sericytochromatia bacterium]